MKKTEALNRMMEQLSLSPEAAVTQWVSEKKLSPNFLLQQAKQAKKLPTIIPAKKFVTPRRIEPGMYRYCDELIYPEVIKGNQISSVVAFVKRKHGFSIGLREANLPWSSEFLFVEGLERATSGQSATRKIIKASQRKHKAAEAAAWCAEYMFDGNQEGTGFLPLKEEAEQVAPNTEKISSALRALGFPTLNSWYWLAGQGDLIHAYRWEIGYHRCPPHMKIYKHNVRCFFAF